MKVAGNEMRDQGIDVDAQTLVRMVTTTAADIAGVGSHLGRLRPERPADLVLLSRLAEEPHDSVLLSDTNDVEMVVIGGDVTYVRADWGEQLALSGSAPNLRPIIAWGKRMLLDNGYRFRPGQDGVPTLDELRADLVRVFPQLGPIWS